MLSQQDNMASKIPDDFAERVRHRTAEIRRAIAAHDAVLSGTLQTRTKRCGQARCACQEDPAARHGPYHEWTRRRDGRQVNTKLDAEEAAIVASAIEDYRAVQGLLARWEREVEAELLDENRRKSCK